LRCVRAQPTGNELTILNILRGCDLEQIIGVIRKMNMKSKTEPSTTPTLQRVFESVGPVARAFDESRPCALKVIHSAGPTSEKLWQLETDIRGTAKQTSSRMLTGIVNQLLSTVGLPSPETLAAQIDQIFTATTGFERACIVILTFGDDLRSLKEREELHLLLESLLDAWDFLFQMQCDTYVLRNAALTYKILDKMISEIVKVKDFGGKARGELAVFVSSCRNGFQRLTHGRTDEVIDDETREIEEMISATAPRLRETLASIKEQWPDLLKAVEELKPHLEEMAEKVDIALNVT